MAKGGIPKSPYNIKFSKNPYTLESLTLAIPDIKLNQFQKHD